MKIRSLKDLLFYFFPQLRVIKLSFSFFKCSYHIYTNRKKMKFPMKILISSVATLIFILIFGFLVFPKMIKGKIKSMTPVIPGNDMREMFVKVPFGLDFKIYLFNVTNPLDVQNGATPNLIEVGPYCYSEWKEKIDISDNESDDTMKYRAMDTFLKNNAPGCSSDEEIVTVLHPLLVGMVNTVSRTKPAMLSLVNKAVNAIYHQPPSIYLTVKAKDLLFDGVIIDCNTTEFAGKAVCSQLRQSPDLKQISETELGFSIFGPKNATPGKEFKIYRGDKKSRNLGKIIEFDEKKQLETWPGKDCNRITGTDGTIFPPFLKKEEGLESFSPELCRTLVARFEETTKYDGIPVWMYSANLGDMSKNPDERCFCPTNDTCLKKGIMDLFMCNGVPIYASLPHFYDSDQSYVDGVKGMKPEKEKHGIEILFEHMTGAPVYARKRLQFSMPLEPNQKVDLFKQLPTIVHPIFWVEEGVTLNNTYTKPVKDLFKILKIFEVMKWLIVAASIFGILIAVYMLYKSTGDVNITPVQKVKPVSSNMSSHNISIINNKNNENGYLNRAMSENEMN